MAGSVAAPAPASSTTMPPMAPTSSNPGNGDANSPTSDSPTLSRTSSNISGRMRSASLRLADAPIPTGAWSGIGQSAGKAPSLADLRRGSIASSDSSGIRRTGTGLSQKRTRSRAGTVTAVAQQPQPVLERQDECAIEDNGTGDQAKKEIAEMGIENTLSRDSDEGVSRAGVEKNIDTVAEASVPPHLPHKVQPEPNELGLYPNGYHFPPKKTWGEATKLGLKGLVRFTFTPVGFLIVIYGCNVIAWGGMLFLLLCNASPAMCTLGDGRYDCNDIDSPRRVWIEYDSQILTALFCVTAFGLAPWRFRDLWFWGLWRLCGKKSALRTLAGYKNGWFRLKGSEDLPDDFGPESKAADWAVIQCDLYPKPRKNVPAPPLTGARAPSSAYWKLDFVVWCMVWNTFFQCVLCGLMWGFNRYNRPSWGTGLFVALGCVIAGVGGIMEMVEGKRVKAVEGVPLGAAEAIADLESGGQGSKEKSDARPSTPQQKEVKGEKI